MKPKSQTATLAPTKELAFAKCSDGSATSTAHTCPPIKVFLTTTPALPPPRYEFKRFLPQDGAVPSKPSSIHAAQTASTAHPATLTTLLTLGLLTNHPRHPRAAISPPYPLRLPQLQLQHSERQHARRPRCLPQRPPRPPPPWPRTSSIFLPMHRRIPLRSYRRSPRCSYRRSPLRSYRRSPRRSPRRLSSTRSWRPHRRQ